MLNSFSFYVQPSAFFLPAPTTPSMGAGRECFVPRVSCATYRIIIFMASESKLFFKREISRGNRFAIRVLIIIWASKFFRWVSLFSINDKKVRHMHIFSLLSFSLFHFASTIRFMSFILYQFFAHRLLIEMTAHQTCCYGGFQWM